MVPTGSGKPGNPGKMRRPFPVRVLKIRENGHFGCFLGKSEKTEKLSGKIREKSFISGNPAGFGVKLFVQLLGVQFLKNTEVGPVQWLVRTCHQGWTRESKLLNFVRNMFVNKTNVKYATRQT